MADDPTQEDYLAVVSDWVPASGVGRVYPIYSLTAERVVEDPAVEFPKVGNVFLLWRGQLQTWDFIFFRPQVNNRPPSRPDDALYICHSPSAALTGAAPSLTVASLLQLSEFDAMTPTNIIRTVTQNVTPIFFVWARATERAFGPLLRGQVHRDEYGSPVEVSWTPLADNIIYEFTQQELEEQGVFVREYHPPTYHQTEFFGGPLSFLAGPVAAAKSLTTHDRLSGAQLAEWYLRFREQVADLPESILNAAKAAADRLSAEDSEIIRRRCRKLSVIFHTLEELQTERAAVARHFVSSEDGQRMVRQELAREVDRRGQEIEGEVAKRNQERVAERDRLDVEHRQLKEEYESKLMGLREEHELYAEENKRLEHAKQELTTALQSGAEQLSTILQREVPLLAAVAAVVRHAARGDEASGTATAQPAERPTWRPVEMMKPSKELEEVRDEVTLVNRLADELGADPLRFHPEFIANLYIALKCSALNLIMGPPGYGKSSVVESLAEALGHSNAFLGVTVRRSWSDDRHLLGFYDSFNSRYDPGSTGVATLLAKAEHEWEANGPGIFICLLDEFNLAAPEYYFSQLLQTLPASREGPKALRLFDPALRTGVPGEGSEILRVCPNISFWGTINYDETTERLSPRLLDRTGMIFLTPADVQKRYPGDSSRPTSAVESKRPVVKGVRPRQVFQTFRRGSAQCPEESWRLLQPLVPRPD